jgi:hypothetical protein
VVGFALSATTRFLGLRGLNVIYEPLEDGAELLDEEYTDPTPEQFRRFPVQKSDLAVFQEDPPSARIPIT